MYCKSWFGSRPVDQTKWCQTIIVGGLLPVIAWAEPGVSQDFAPYLLAFIVLLALAIVFVVVRWGHFAPALHTPLRRWLAALILALLFLVFAGPYIYIIGAVAITGRTM